MKINNNKIILLLVFVLVLLIFLTSCSKTSSDITTQNYKKGYGNLMISTLENYPPDEVYSESDFKIIVKLDNQGAYQLTNGQVKLLGLDETYIYLFETKKDISSLEGNPFLEGKSITSPNGEFTFVEFEATTKKIPAGAEELKLPYFISVDYNYQTELSQTVCINPNIYQTYDSGCKLDSKTSFSGQGSPLAVTEVEEIIYDTIFPKVEFRFKIKNQGKGKVKKVTLNKATLGGEEIKCEFRDSDKNKLEVVFKEDKETILICQKKLNEQKSYQTVVLLNLAFQYTLQEKKTLVIKK